MHEHLRYEFGGRCGAGGVGDEHYDPALGKRWEQELAAGGWVGIGWPRPMAAAACRWARQVVFHEEYVRVGGLAASPTSAETLLAPTLIEFGSAEQQRASCRASATAPGTGAGLFGSQRHFPDLPTCRRAPAGAGDEWAIDGQKV